MEVGIELCSSMDLSLSFSLSARRAYMRDRALPGEVMPADAGAAVEEGRGMDVSGSVAVAKGGKVDVTGDVTAEAVGPVGDLSSGIASDAASAASILESNSKSSNVPSKVANSKSPSLAEFG
jgi:hypothetical protein